MYLGFLIREKCIQAVSKPTITPVHFARCNHLERHYVIYYKSIV